MNPISFSTDFNSLYPIDTQSDSQDVNNTSTSETTWETSTLDRFRSESGAYTWNVDEWDASIDYHALEKEADAMMDVSDDSFECSYEKIWHFEDVEVMYAKAAYAAEKAGDYDTAFALQQKRAALVEQKLDEKYEAIRVLEKSADLYASYGRDDLAKTLYLQALDVVERWQTEACSQSDSTTDFYSGIEKIEILFSKAQLLEKLGEEDACKITYKQAADLLMQQDEGFFESTITPFALAGFCYERAGELQLAREAFQKELGFILVWLEELKKEITKQIAQFQEKKETEFGSDSDFLNLDSFEIFIFSRISREAQLCAERVGDRDLFQSLMEQEYSLYKEYMDFCNPEQLKNRDFEFLEPDLFFAAEYLSLSEFLQFFYQDLNPQRAAQIQIEAADVKQRLEQGLSKRNFKELNKFTEALKENLKELFSSDGKSIEEILDLLNKLGY